MAYQASKDELSRGQAFWNRQVQVAQYVFSRTVGDVKLQKVLDLETKFRAIASQCKTYGPCSRECVK